VLLDDETGSSRGNDAAGRRSIARTKRFGRADGIALAAVIFEMGVAGSTHGMGLGAGTAAFRPRPERSISDLALSIAERGDSLVLASNWRD
jgi:hypothetical protein